MRRYLLLMGALVLMLSMVAACGDDDDDDDTDLADDITVTAPDTDDEATEADDDAGMTATTGDGEATGTEDSAGADVTGTESDGAAGTMDADATGTDDDDDADDGTETDDDDATGTEDDDMDDATGTEDDDADDDDATGTDDDTAEGTAGDDDDDDGFGEPVTIGDFILTVNDVMVLDSGGIVAPDEGNQFIGVEMTVENTGSSSVGISEALLQTHLEDDDGAEYDIDLTATAIAIFSGGFDAASEIEPGSEITGVAGFQVPDDLSPDDLTLVIVPEDGERVNIPLDGDDDTP